MASTVPPITAPNYQAAATQQGQANLQAGQQTTQISNPNIVNPYGSQTVTYGPDGTPTVTQSLSQAGQDRLTAANSLGQDGITRIAEMTAPALSSYNFSGVDRFDMSGVPQTRAVDLNALPQVTALSSGGLFDIAPINTANLTARQTMPTTQGQSMVAEALRQREAPRFERTASQAENDLLVRGFNPGTQGYDARMDEIRRAENDFNLGLAALSGQEQSRLFDMESGLRSQELNEMLSGQSSAQSARGQLFGERESISNFEKSLRDQGLNEQQVRAQVDNMIRQQALAEQVAKIGTQEQARGREVSEAITGRQLPIQEYAAIQEAVNPAMPQFQQFQGATVNAAPVFDATTQQGLFDLSKYGIDVERAIARDQRKAQESASKRQGWTDLFSSIAGYAGTR